MAIFLLLSIFIGLVFMFRGSENGKTRYLLQSICVLVVECSELSFSSLLFKILLSFLFIFDFCLEVREREEGF